MNYQTRALLLIAFVELLYKKIEEKRYSTRTAYTPSNDGEYESQYFFIRE